MGFFFNLDSRLMGLIESHGLNDRDLKSIRFIAIHFLELWKREFVDKYSLEAWNELYDKYHITNEDEGKIKKKEKIEALKVLGFSEDEAKILCTMSKEDLKLYTEARKQKNWRDQTNQKRDEQKAQAEHAKLVEKKRDLEGEIKFYKEFNEQHNLKKAEERLKEINEKLGD